MTNATQPKAFKVRDDYVFFKNDKPTELRVIPADDPDLRGQMHKVEPLFGTDADEAVSARKLETRAVDISRLSGLTRDELIEAYKQAFEKAPPEGATKREILKPLRDYYKEQLEQALEADGA